MQAPSPLPKHKVVLVVKRTVKIVLWVLAASWLLLLLLIATLQIPPVQKILREKLVTALTAKLHTRVEVGNIGISIFGNLVITRLCLPDDRKDTLLVFQKLSVGIHPFALLHQRVMISSVSLAGAHFWYCDWRNVCFSKNTFFRLPKGYSYPTPAGITANADIVAFLPDIIYRKPYNSIIVSSITRHCNNLKYLPMEEHVVKIVSIEQVTHDVKRFRVEKPAGYSFTPGQATEVSIHQPEQVKEKRPFTFTSLPSDPYLEFTIKIYQSHHGVTDALNKLEPGAELIIHDVWGAISYKGKGMFIAGGAGVTPFISIFRYLESTHKLAGNKLIFTNKTKADIILEPEFTRLLGKAFVNILSEEKVGGYFYGKIDEQFLKSNILDFDKKVYVCGPPPMMDAVIKQLSNIGIEDSLITVEI